MSDTAAQPRAGEVPTSEDFPAHFFCHICYPECYPGMQAICGAELLGINARPEDPTCEPCDRRALHHIRSHFK